MSRQRDPLRPFIPSWLDDARLDPFEFRILCRIVRRWSPEIGCTESIPNMAAGCMMDKKTAYRAVDGLENRQMIRRTKRPGQSSRIDLTTALRRLARFEEPHPETGTPPPEPAVEPDPDTGMPPHPETGTDSDTLPGNGEAPYPNTGRQPYPETGNKGYPERVSLEGTPEQSDSDDQEEDLFELFWNTYGKKVGRRKCERKFASLPRADQLDAIAFAKLYHDHCQESSWLTQRNPETYLNNHNWNDEHLPDETPVLRDERGRVTGFGPGPESQNASASVSAGAAGSMRPGVRSRSARQTAALSNEQYLRDAGFTDTELAELIGSDRDSDSRQIESAHPDRE